MRNRHVGKLLPLVISLAAAMPLYAQQTSGAMSGTVIDANGQPVVGAEIEIRHLPTNSVRTVITDASGRYNARGLRVGGPFTVEASKDGLPTTKTEGVAVPLGDAVDVDLTFRPTAAQAQGDAVELETVAVVASSANSVFQPDTMGSTTQITRQQIELAPSIDQSIQDYVRLDPRITITDKERGEISAAGQNNRYNSVTIDGVKSNDDFGLNASGLPSQNQPISTEWIQEFNIGISPYDASEGDFVGASINAVTRSGGNEFAGAGYIRYRDNDMVRDNADGTPFSRFSDEKTYGAWLSGPILTDKLFFFIGYEKFERASPGPDIDVLETPTVGNTTQFQGRLSDLNRIGSIANTRYAIATGSTALPGIDNVDDKVIAKLDWNINDQHRVSGRYNRTSGELLDIQAISTTNYSFSDYWFLRTQEFENYVGQWYADWSPNFSTEASISQANYRSARLDATPSPSVRVTLPAAQTGAPTTNVFFGTERSSQANLLKTSNTTAYFEGTYFLGDHAIKGGIDYAKYDIFNVFLQDFYGQYQFASIADFEAGRPSFFAVRVPTIPTITSNGITRTFTGNAADAAAIWAYDTVGAFIQDTWTVSPNLNILFGLRYDVPVIDESPIFNPDFARVFGRDNSSTIDGNEVIQPRVGFNYTFDTVRATQLRGGFGLFTGSAPGVWLSNPYSNSGLNSTEFTCTSSTACAATNQIFNPNPFSQVPRGAAGGVQNVDVVDGAMEQPAVWKANIAFDHELPWYEIVAGVDIGFSETEAGIMYEHLNLGAPNGTLPDGRLNYWRTLNPGNFVNPLNPNANAIRSNRPLAAIGTNPLTAGNFNNVLLLRKTNKGSTRDVSFNLSQRLDSGWSWKLGYTVGQSEDVNSGTSSVANSNWVNRAVFNVNEEIASTSNYEIRGRGILAVNYQQAIFGDLKTSVGMFFEARAGRPYSFTFNNDANGDGVFGNDLLYIPTGANDARVTYTTPQFATAFAEYVANNRWLSDRQGQVFERNAARSPWVNQMDIRIAQEIPGIPGFGAGEVFLNILNAGNLVNNKWGNIDEVGFPYTARIANFAGVDAQGRFVYAPVGAGVSPDGTYNPNILTRRDVVGESRWAFQLGVRYEF